MKELNDIDAVKRDTSKFCDVDGNRGLGVTPFAGERYPTVWFSTVTSKSPWEQGEAVVKRSMARLK